MHYFSRKKAAVSSLEWQFPHDDYKPRERPAAACTSHGSGLSALTGSGVGLHVAASRHRPTVGPNTKNPPKMRFKKFVKLTDHTGVNSLTNFKSEAPAKTGNGSYENMTKLAWINS